tara:strand:- start:2558 stop:3085 length:528 start_codon:yes stop_codon:yes gene_type:complete
LNGVVNATPSFHQYDTFDAAIKRLYPNATVVSKDITLDHHEIATIEEWTHQLLPSANMVVHYITKDQTLQGYALILDQLGKHYPITFLVTITPDFMVNEVVVLIYREDYGNKVRKKRFLNQFQKKSLSDPIAVNNDITSISGATISSYAIANGVKQSLAILDSVKDKLQKQVKSI